jgi:HSP20 family protein
LLIWKKYGVDRGDKSRALARFTRPVLFPRRDLNMSRQTAIQTTSANDIQVPSQPQNLAAPVEQPWSYLPAIDVIEAEHEYTIVCDAPGLVNDQISLTYEAGVLNLHGPVASRYPQPVKFLRQEYGVGDFDRSIPLGRLAGFIDRERMSARYECGVLSVHLPKLASARGRKVRVSVG